jgi:hypothetical protein
MPTLRLKATGVSLHIVSGDSHGELAAVLNKGDTPFNPSFEHYLRYSVQRDTPFRDSIKLATGETFDELQGTVIVKPLTATTATDTAIGALSYFEAFDSDFDYEPAGYSATVVVAFEELVAAARIGRLPDRMALHVVGEHVKYGWEPDGSGVEWDNKNSPHLRVREALFRLSFVMAENDAEKQSDNRQREAELPASRSQADQLLAHVQSIGKTLGQLARNVMWTAIGLTIILLAFR